MLCTIFILHSKFIGEGCPVTIDPPDFFVSPLFSRFLLSNRGKTKEQKAGTGIEIYWQVHVQVKIRFCLFTVSKCSGELTWNVVNLAGS